MTEERYLKIICISLKILAWFLLIFGIVFSISIAAVLTPFIFTTRWLGVVVLLSFILVFLFINLLIKIAEIAFAIKKKVVLS